MRDQTPPLTPELLLHAYASGVFPMSESKDDPEVFWVDPKRRGIIPLDGFHISRSLGRSMRRCDYRVSFDTAFGKVVEGCADRDETWINETIFRLYGHLHEAGVAHSVEVWEGEELVGGCYGVALGGAFFGESMFSRRTDTSKMALAWMVDRLNQGGFTLFDTQFLTPHLATLGAIEVSRARYRGLLAAALEIDADFDRAETVPSAQELLQRNIQTS